MLSKLDVSFAHCVKAAFNVVPFRSTNRYNLPTPSGECRRMTNKEKYNETRCAYWPRGIIGKYPWYSSGCVTGKETSTTLSGQFDLTKQLEKLNLIKGHECCNLFIVCQLVEDFGNHMPPNSRYVDHVYCILWCLKLHVIFFRKD